VSEPAGPAPPPPAPLIANAASLADHGMVDLRACALRIAGAGLTAADPATAVRDCVALDGDDLVVAGVPYRLAPGGRLVVLGAGKATWAISAALEQVLGERLDGGLIAVEGEPEPLSRIEVMVGEHPLPGRGSLAAGQRLLELAADLGPDDVAICCFTGGSSALSVAPPAGVTLEAKRELHRLLLSSGMPVVEVNAVRKHASLAKGGRIAARAAPARIVNLTVSDVAGDPLDAITDPTVPDGTTRADAVEILRAYDLWPRIDSGLRAHLENAAAESPAPDVSLIQSVLLASGATVCDAMTIEATAAGIGAAVISTTLEGEARWIGGFLANLARESAVRGSPFAPPVALLGCGGEGTVELDGDSSFGLGGPNQEGALAAALQLDGQPVAALLVDTDGGDGGTAIAGGLVDGMTAPSADADGIEIAAALRAHRSSQALAALGDAVRTGSTGTNVNDLFVVVVGAAP
jgi:glycerate 2-kinase